jgi:hypothetical protein
LRACSKPSRAEIATVSMMAQCASWVGAAAQPAVHRLPRAMVATRCGCAARFRIEPPSRFVCRARRTNATMTTRTRLRQRSFAVVFVYFIMQLAGLPSHPQPPTIHDTVPERLRRLSRNPLGSARRGSNPLGVDLATPRRGSARCCDAQPPRHITASLVLRCQSTVAALGAAAAPAAPTAQDNGAPPPRNHQDFGVYVIGAMAQMFFGGNRLNLSTAMS